MAWGSDQAHRIWDRYRERFEAVRRDTSRTPDWHKLRLAELWLDMQAEVTQVREQAAADGQAHIRSLTRKAFGTDGISGDAGSLAISMRDAADRVAQVENRDELVRLLDGATHSGDEVLARAVARQAFERGDTDLLDTYTSIRPEAAASLGKLRDMTTDTLHSRLHESMLANAAKPHELHGMDEFACQRLLDNADRHGIAEQQMSDFSDTVRTGFGR
jgi:hypothetical protein